MKRLIPITFILIGILLIIYPNAKQAYYDYQQEKLIVDWQESMLNIDVPQLNTSETVTDKSKDKSTSVTEAQQLKIEQEKQEIERLEREKKEQEEKKHREAYIKSSMEGMLTIDAIDLKIPILTDATTKNLNISVSSIINTGKVGQVGNYCIAGHNSKDYGKNFSRLSEVEVGDKVKVNDGAKDYVYIIYDKFLVDPKEIWVLKGNDKDKEITFITCDQVYNSTKRLIVKGKIDNK